MANDGSLLQPVFFSRPDASRIGLVSDTHIPERGQRLHPRLLEVLAGADLILHAGDISSPGVLEDLRTLAETVAVQGNNPGDRRFHPALPRRAVIEAAFGLRIGVIHGDGSLWQLIGDNIIGRSGFARAGVMRLVRRVTPSFSGIPCIVCGHAHWPFTHFDSSRLVVNPGKAFGDKEATCAVLEIREKEIGVLFHAFGDPGRLGRIAGLEHVFTLPD